MKKILAILLITALCASPSAFAQDKLLKKAMELSITREGGQNGGAVAWHPKQKKYYAAIAGNTSFPLAVFDQKGKLLSSPELETMFDIRGLWFNEKTGELNMNGYADYGWAKYKLDDKGIPTDVETLFEEMNQPEENSVGSYLGKEHAVYFVDSYGYVSRFDAETAFIMDDVALKIGNLPEDEIIDELSSYNLSYVAVPKAGEVALLNVTANQIEVYETKTGSLKSRLKLPPNASADTWMNFSYANGMYWLFNKETRKWIAYK